MSCDADFCLQGAELSDALRAPCLVAWNCPVVWIAVESRVLIRAAEDTGTFHRSSIDERRFDRGRVGQRSTRTTESFRSRRPHAAIQSSRFPLPCDESDVTVGG